MKGPMKRLAFALLLLPSLALADGIAYRVGKGVQITPTAAAPTKGSGNALLWVDSTASNALKYKNPAGVTVTLGAGTGSYNQTIEDEGTPLTQRTNLNFVGAGISCADSGGKTVCTISSGGSTGNWTFTGDAADDTGAAVLTIGATTATGVTIGRTAGANILAADTTLASGKTLTGAAASDLYLNAVTGQLVRLRVNGSNMLSVSSTAATLTVPLVMTGTQTGTYTLGGTPTITAPVISGGLTASGSASNDFSASTGTFKTSTGTLTVSGDLQMASGKHIYGGGSTSAADFSAGSGIFKTTTGAASYLGSSNVFTSSINPLTTGSVDLGDGATTKFWRKAYVNSVGFASTFTLGQYGGTNYLSLLDATCNTGATTCTRVVGSQGRHTTLEVAPATATTLPASTEHVDVLLDMYRAGNDVQFSTGALTTQRSILVRRPRYAFVGASTVTNVATMAIEAAPEASTNATFTNAYAFWVQDGAAKFQGDGTGATVGAAGVILDNTTAATAANQKYSPALIWSGNGWKTNATAASQSTQFLAQVIPVQGTANPTAGLSFQSNVNAAGWVERLNVGNTAILASVPITANLGATTVAPTWTAVTYQNSWVDNSGSSVSRYTKDALGMVTVEIRMKTGTNGTTAFTLPAGYRPGQTITVVGIVSAGTIAVGDISSAGVFTISISSTAGTFARVHYHAEG